MRLQNVIVTNSNKLVDENGNGDKPGSSEGGDLAANSADVVSVVQIE